MTTSSIKPSISTTLGGHDVHTIAELPVSAVPLSPLTLREVLDRKQDAQQAVAVCADLDVTHGLSFPANEHSRVVLDRYRLLDAGLLARVQVTA